MKLKAETAKAPRTAKTAPLDELLQLRASVGGVETGLALFAAHGHGPKRGTCGREDADKIQSDISMLRRVTILLRTAQEDQPANSAAWRASGAANTEIGLEALRTSTGELRQQIARVDMAREATGSIGKPHKAHRIRRARRTPDVEPLPAQPFVAQWPSVLPPSRN